MFFIVNGLEEHILVIVEADGYKELQDIIYSNWGETSFKIVALTKTIPEDPHLPQFYFER